MSETRNDRINRELQEDKKSVVETEPVIDPVIDPVTDPVIDPVTEPVTDPLPSQIIKGKMVPIEQIIGVVVKDV